MLDQLWLVLLGFAAGIIGSMIGLGGGIVTVPVLTFLGFSPAAAASSSLFAVLSNAAASTVSYSRQRRIEMHLGLKLGLLSVPGTIMGAMISSDAAPGIFKMLFGLVLAASAAYMFLRGRMGPRKKRIPLQMAILAVGASFFAGIISSFFGIGGGIIFVPLMVAGMGIAMKRAAPTSQLILLFASVSGAITHILLGHPDLVQAGLLAAGSFAGGLVGAKLSDKMKDSYLRVMAGVAMLVAATRLFYEYAANIWH